MHRIRTIMAVAKKELIQFIRYPTWIIGLTIWPLIFPLMYILTGIAMAGPGGAGTEAFSKVSGTNDFNSFIVIGVMIWMWVNSVMWSFGTSLRDEQTRGTLESNWLCPINRFDMLIGGAIVSIVLGFFIVAVSIIEYKFIYGIKFTGNIFQWIIIFLTLIPGVYGFGTVFASLVLWAKETGAAVQLVRGIIMIFCGISFPIMLMPEWMQGIAKILPFTFGISAARKVMIENLGILGAGKDILACLFIGFTYLIIARVCFMAVEKKVRDSGSLERF
ncbi:ABC transporter permease [Clostridium amazonitimonense]|uniref:ABC transporter permease n=1 Tax=Clostridium amazonitimonense TaxID=1499689 RepID=UPI00050952BF|nr:ABC transporter permease [Clostridium amazonitimonense]